MSSMISRLPESILREDFPAIRSNREIYESLVEYALHSERRPERMIERISEAASFAVSAFPGLLNDSRLDRKLIDIGLSLRTKPPTPHQDGRRKKVLHIATQIYSIGGHTRVIGNWAENDVHSESHLILTNQKAHKLPLLKKVLSSSFKTIQPLPSGTLLDKSRDLRNLLARLNPDLIVLHHHGHDPIPIIAVSYETAPPVLFYNHADHSFSLGTLASSLSVDFRESGQRASLEHRGARKSEVIPYPLRHEQAPNKAQARSRIGIGPNERLIISMASFQKYIPFQIFNFFQTYREILREHADCTMLVIGVPPSRSDIIGTTPLPDNLRCLGPISNPIDYAIAADFFVEPFPLATGLGTFDVIRHGATPIFNYGSACIYGESIEAMFHPGMQWKPYHVEEYKKRVSNALRNTEPRSQQDKYSKFIDQCIGDPWNRLLEQVYQQATNSPRDDSRIPRENPLLTPCSERYAQYCRETTNLNRLLTKTSLMQSSGRRLLRWMEGTVKTTTGKVRRAFQSVAPAQ